MGKGWRLTADLPCTPTKELWLHGFEMLKGYTEFPCTPDSTPLIDEVLSLFMQTPEKHASHHISGILLCCAVNINAAHVCSEFSFIET